MKNKESLWKDDCPFCKNIDIDELLLLETDYWKILYNKYPYYWKNQNLLVVSKKHIEKTTSLSNNELIDFKNIEVFMEKYFNWKNYFSFIRQTHWWRSIKHLHYHYLEWIFFHDWDNWDKKFKIKL